MRKIPSCCQQELGKIVSLFSNKYLGGCYFLLNGLMEGRRSREGGGGGSTGGT